jgi:hypothetical protein
MLRLAVFAVLLITIPVAVLGLQCNQDGTRYDCSFLGLTEVPDDIPKDTTYL